MRLRRSSLVAAGLLLGVALAFVRAARADEEAWAFLELRVPVPHASPWLPSHVRSITDFRVAGRHEGLSAAFWRVGPLWDVHPNLFVAVHGTAIGLASAPEALVPQYRLELEPNVRGRFGAVSFNDRNRLELRWQRGEETWVYRNQLRVNVHATPRLAPFVSEELIYDIDHARVDQSRLQVGLGVSLAGGSRVDVAYQLRSRHPTSGGWRHDHVALVGLLLQHGWPAP